MCVRVSMVGISFCKLWGVEGGVEAEFIHIFKLLSLVSKSSQAIGRRLLLWFSSSVARFSPLAPLLTPALHPSASSPLHLPLFIPSSSSPHLYFVSRLHSDCKVI